MPTGDAEVAKEVMLRGRVRREKRWENRRVERGGRTKLLEGAGFERQS